MKSKIWILLSGIILLMSACSDSATVRDIKGAYRYKTTGTVTLEEHFSGATEADTLLANLDNESGTLEIISLHDGDSLLMTIDQMNGNVVATRGIAAAGRLQFTPYKRTLEVSTTVKEYDTIKIDLGLFTKDTVLVREYREYEPYEITVKGFADIYDNSLVFNLEYNGNSQKTERTLRGRNIISLAKRN